MKTQIKNRFTDEVLFECDVPDGLESGLHVRHAIEQATQQKANLRGANLRGANLVGANLGGAYLGVANLRGANLRGANLVGAYLDGANLGGANLVGANLDGANLVGANLVGAYLGGANLDGANLVGANLVGAYLGGANLDGANLVGANLRGDIKITGARPVFSIGPIGSRQDSLIAFSTDQGLRLKTGCFFGCMEKFRKALIAEHSMNKHREEYEAALFLIEKHFSLWGDE